jgi:hypothetical protein
MTDYKAPTTFKVGSTQTVAVGSSSAATSNAFDSQTREIRIVTTVDAYVEMNATSPTATSSSLRDRRTDTPNDNLKLEDGTYLLIQAGDNIKLEQAVGTVFSGRPIPN